MKIDHIVVPVTCTNISLFVAQYAIFLAKLLSASVTAVYVIDEKVLEDLVMCRVCVQDEATEYEKDLQDQGKRFLERVGKLAVNKNVHYEGVIRKGIISEEVTDIVEEMGADLLVIADWKKPASRKEIICDEGEKIFQGSTCPVVIVRNLQEAERLYKEIS